MARAISSTIPRNPAIFSAIHSCFRPCSRGQNCFIMTPVLIWTGQAYARRSYLLSRSEGRRTLLRAPFESATQAHGALSAAEARSAFWSCRQTAARTDQLTVATGVASVAGTIGKGR